MKAPKLFRRCKRRGCGKRRDVAHPKPLERPGYCSHRCAALDQRLGVNRASAMRRQLMARLDGLTPLQAFRLGYVRGLESKCRQIRKKFILIKIEEWQRIRRGALS